jgi:hypothetical protein
MPASSLVRPSPDARTPRVRSAVTNGSRLHVVPPGDGKWARRFADVLAEIISDLSGPDGLSEAQRQLARRAATIAIACERLEGEAAAGNEIDLELFGALTDRLGRCLQRLSPSLERRAREVGPTLTDLIRADQERQRQALVRQP